MAGKNKHSATRPHKARLCHTANAHAPPTMIALPACLVDRVSLSEGLVINTLLTRTTLKAALACLGLLAAGVSHADVKLMVAMDPSISRPILLTSYSDLATTLGAALGQPVRVEHSSRFADVLRSTRTGEYDLLIVPGHVAASALAHQYELVATSGKPETYVLVVKPGIRSVTQLAGSKIYLAQQDSLYTYMAKGLLNEAGGSLTSAASVRYERTSGAGLVAVLWGTMDATVTRKAEYDDWVKTHGGKADVLIESKPVPGGLTMVVSKALAEPLRAKVAQWAAGAGPAQAGLGQMSPVADASTYRYVGSLGHFTPQQLPGATRISAAQAAELISQGAQAADVRSEKEYKIKHIAGTTLIPYIEKSTKDTAFDAKLDDFSALDKLDKSKPVIFACNGAECWKSYKASKTALAKGFKTVYWLRGGLPEWEEAKLPIEKS